MARLTNDRTSSAAPTSKAQTNAISPTSNARVTIRTARVSVPARSVTRRDESTSTRVPIHAGSRPTVSIAMTPETEVTARARTSTLSGFRVRSRKASGRNARVSDTSVQPMPMPAITLSTASTLLSTKAWRASRARAPPSADRMANSRWRAVSRARSKLQTLAHSTRKTRTTPPASNGTARW